jgi:hypothetical protein
MSGKRPRRPGQGAGASSQPNRTSGAFRENAGALIRSDSPSSLCKHALGDLQGRPGPTRPHHLLGRRRNNQQHQLPGCSRQSASLSATKENESSWIFEQGLTCSNTLRRVQNPGFSLVNAGNRCADSRFRRSHPTVGAKVCVQTAQRYAFFSVHDVGGSINLRDTAVMDSASGGLRQPEGPASGQP